MFKAICRWPDGRCNFKIFKDERDALDWIIRVKALCARRALSEPNAEILKV